jgi:hemoglobin/transferrin/lactoferrin receptor protein
VKHFRIFQIALLCALLVLPAMAQEHTPDNQPTDDPQVVPSTDPNDPRVFTDRIVVTASRQEEESADTPAPITVLTRDDIERTQPEKMADLFKQIPGVEVQGEGPFRGIPVIRAFSSNRILILVDGQRLNNARESTLFAGIQPGLVDLTQVERIEVLRGPASVMYGSDAIGGVINIITRQPDLGRSGFSWTGNAAYEYGENSSSQRASFDLTGSGSGFSIRIGAGLQDAEDYSSPEGEVPNSGMEQQSFNTSLRWLVGSSGVLRVSGEIVRTSDIGFPGFDPETSGIDIQFPRFDRDKISTTWDSGPLWGLTNLSTSVYYQTVTKESRMNLDFGQFFRFSTTTSDIDGFGANIQSIADLGNHHLTFGLDFYRDDVKDDAVVATPWGTTNQVSVPESFQQGIGAYFQDDVALSDRAMLSLGLRGDSFTFKSEDDPYYVGEPFDTSDSALSGNIGLVYAITDHVDLTALVGRGFRSPNLQERSYMGLASTGDTLILQNPDLDAESSLNYEVGFKARYSRYFGGLNLYYNDVTDLITFMFLGEDPDSGLQLSQFDNIGEATIRGIELELETLFARSWTAFTNAAYSRGENKIEDEPLGFIPPLKVVVGLRFQPSTWWVEGSARIVGDQDRVPDDQNPSEGFTTFDLRGGFDFGNGLRLQATFGNLADKTYAEPFNNRFEPGRNFRVGVNYGF